jgi:hypothetical protein
MHIGMPSSFFRMAVIYGFLGMLLGIHMAASGNHGQMVTHAHLMLIGWVTTFLYGAYLKMNPSAGGTLAKVLWWIATIGAIVTIVGLFLLYGAISLEMGEPLATAGSLTVAAGMALFLFMVWRTQE